MSRNPRLFFVSIALLFIIVACSLPSGAKPEQPDYVATITAQALLISPTESQTETAEPSTDAIPSAPTVNVTSPTNCRTGPGTEYDLVLAVNPGQTFEIVGKGAPDNYWIINNPTGGTCWLWGQYAVVSGNANAVPDYPPPPPPTKSVANTNITKTPKPTSLAPSPAPSLAPPNSPSNINGDRTCGTVVKDNQQHWQELATITWQDNADNETGYRFYKNGSPLPEIPPNSTQYNITLRYPHGTGGALFDTFAVEAFNAAGSSERIAVLVYRCP
jgi:hypothetical protein